MISDFAMRQVHAASIFDSLYLPLVSTHFCAYALLCFVPRPLPCCFPFLDETRDVWVELRETVRSRREAKTCKETEMETEDQKFNLREKQKTERQK